MLNTTTIGGKITGLGVYSKHCILALTTRFKTQRIGESASSKTYKAPLGISIGSGKFAALKRAFWLNSRKVGSNYVVYSPTHHGLLGASRQIITIHDLIALKFPRQHPLQFLYFRFFVPVLLKKCEAVFTVSEFSKSDICRTYGYPDSKVHVVPNGVDVNEFSPKTGAYSGSPFLLVVGANYSHKNIEELLDQHIHWDHHFRLVIASCGGGYRKKLEERAATYGLTSIITFHEYLDFADLVTLYQNATALIYPSKFEGFGIPPLESLACGTPVIVSDIPVLREVLSDAAFYVKLGDSDSWSRAFSMIQSSIAVDERLKNSVQVLRKFSWETSAAQLVDALIKVEPALSNGADPDA